MDTDRVAELQRGEDAGAVWSVLAREEDRGTGGVLGGGGVGGRGRRLVGPRPERGSGDGRVVAVRRRRRGGSVHFGRPAVARLHRRAIQQHGRLRAIVDSVDVGRLTFAPVAEAMNLVGDPVRRHIGQAGGDGLWVSEIDPELADTAAFCEHYDIGLDTSANCVVVEAKRADRVWYAACMVLATTRADVNGIVRKHLDARKISFAAMDTAVTLTAMEYDGITPV